MTVEERFWAKVRKTDGCWLWTASLVGRPGKPRYGGFKARADGDWRTVRAHRFVWELTYGPIPKGLCVCHRCDNPLCVRPDHLFLGTHADNIRDRDRKGRHRAPRGTENGHAKVTPEIVRAIRESDERQRVLAARYGIDQSTVSVIKSGKGWKHVKPLTRA